MQVIEYRVFVRGQKKHVAIFPTMKAATAFAERLHTEYEIVRMTVDE